MAEAVVPDRWCLVPIPFGEGDPYIVGFRSREHALVYRGEHGWSEDDWRPLPVKLKGRGHEAVCAHCGEDWPCRHAREEKVIRREVFWLERRCPRCESPVDTGQLAIVIATKAGRTWFHGRKGKCRTAAYRMAREHPDADIVREDSYSGTISRTRSSG